MKMEVLSVQNQFQGQYGVIGSSKVKDWTSPLTPPPSSHNHHHHHNHSNNKKENNENVDATKPSINNRSTNNKINADTTNNSTRYNSNLICVSDDDASVNALSMRLQSELRAAKSRHLACTEVLLPADLLHRISAEIIKVSEKEPCGIRGCTVYVEFEDEPSNTRRIASLKVDPNTVSTFELYLTIKHDRSGWTSILPQFLKNLARSSTIMISPDFTLTKNKLYHSFSE